jgi:tetratricopeptide (TPR) repeat protein
MPQLPFDIPKSLSSYAEHFDDDPIKATTRLKKQLKKRGPDAVGHFLLAWFYHLKGMDEQAVEEALKARIFAPGSPFFQKLHYYLSHPKAFEAWTPDKDSSPSPSSPVRSPRKPDPVLDLDSLIQKLSEVESKRIRPKEHPDQFQEKNQDTPEEDVDDIVSETLANIHEQQGKIDAAIQTYQRLVKIHPEKEEEYKKQINRLGKLKEETEGENN